MNQTIGVNITPQSFQPTLHYSQGDVGRVFVVNVTDYDIPSGATVTCVATKPSGMGFTVSGTVSGNSVTFTSTAEMTDEWGRFPAEIRIASGNTLLGTSNFLMIGEKDPHPASTIDGTQEELIPQLTLLVNRVEAAAESVHDLTVSATTLTAGSDATATYDSTNNSIEFGIPRGADGDVTRSEFNDLKSDLSAEIQSTSSDEKTISATLWEQGYISPITGNNGSNTDSIRVKSNVFIEGANIIKAKTGYGFRIFAYQLDGTFVGSWNGTQFAKSWDYKLITEFTTIKYGTYKFRVFLQRSDLSTIAVSEAPNLVVLYDNISALQTSIDAIESDVYNSTNFLDSDWRIGGISPTSGLNNNDSTGVSFIENFYVSSGLGFNEVKCTSQYGFYVFAYQLDGTFVGSWNGTQFAKSWDYVRVRDFNLKTYPSYKFRFALYGEDNHAMTISERSNITFTLNNFIQLYKSATVVNELIAYTPLDIMDRGNIYAPELPNKPWWSNSTTRVRTMDGHFIPLSVGDKITLTDYTDVKMYVFWENASGVWSAVGWISKDFEVTEAGDYALLLRNEPETTIDDYNDLASLVVIYKHTSIFDDVYADIDKNQRRDWIVKSINHRGFGRTAPENTLPAFKLSAKYGWQYVETDVRFTSDGVAVLLHDESINRTARNADGTSISSTINISDITYAEALTYDFGIWMGTQYEGTKIPTLEEFLILCKKLSLDAYLELKSYSDADIQYITNMVNRCGMRNHVSYLCFGYSALETVLSYDPTARVGALGDVGSSMITAMANMKTDINDVFINANFATLTTSLIDDVATAKVPLEVYTLNAASTINTMDKYITGVTSDYNVAGKDLYNLNV